jgi:hypothetical protein
MFAGSQWGLDMYVQQRLKELYREAEAERLAAEIAPRGRSLRQRVAAGLYALAARVEGPSRRTAQHEGAPIAA